MGLANGTSWADAWTNPLQVAGIAPGDTVYISGGPFGGAGQVYSNVHDWRLPTGSAGHPITFMVGQDGAHSGPVIFDGAMASGANADGGHQYQTFLSGGSHWRLSGNYQGLQQIVVRNYYAVTNLPQDVFTSWPGDDNPINVSGQTDIALDHLQLFCTMELVNVGEEVAYCLIQPPDNQTGAIHLGEGMCGADYGITNLIHDNTFLCAQNYSPTANIVNGGGTQGLTGGECVSVYSNLFTTYGVTDFDADVAHQDCWINEGGSNCRFFDNRCVNFPNYGVFWDPVGPMSGGGTTTSNVWIYNNVFEMANWLSVGQMQAGQNENAVVIGSQYSGTWHWSGMLIANNTIVDLVNEGVSVIGIGGNSETWANCLVANNLIFDCGLAGRYEISFSDGNTNGIRFAYNYLGAGSYGGHTNSPAQLPPPAGCTALGGSTTAVQFVSYSLLNTNSDLHLATNDTACAGQGMNLSAYFGTAADGTARPASGAWDIGAYQTSTGSVTNSPGESPAPTALVALEFSNVVETCRTKLKIDHSAMTTDTLTTCKVDTLLVANNTGSADSSNFPILVWMGQGGAFDPMAGTWTGMRKVKPLKQNRSVTIKLGRRFTGSQAGTFIYATDVSSNVLTSVAIPN
ncbi:MAG TPA: hypothetical protein VMV72_12000 [Verrucomicrobiae bacterium]|nr:hypothetical protein [Verrucomicrobiae bacterium]